MSATDHHQPAEGHQGEIEAGTFDWRVDLEVRMNIEARPDRPHRHRRQKLHTGRSRNDQVATDIRLWLRDEIDVILGEITRLQQGLLGLAEAEADTIMPGFTHLQTAQPVTFGHHLLAWFEMLSRDYERLVDCRKRTACRSARPHWPAPPTRSSGKSPASCWVSKRFPATRWTASPIATSPSILRRRLRGDDAPVAFLRRAGALTSAQFQFIDLPDRFCTGSSIMPQKKNPDVPSWYAARPAACSAR